MVRRWSRCLVLLLVVVVAAGLVVATPWPGGASAAVGEIPEQEWGSASGRSHVASSAATNTTLKVERQDAVEPTKGLGKDQRFPSRGIEDAPVRETTVEVGEAEPVVAAEGFNAATSRELAAEGSPDRQVFANADGTRTMRVYQGRQFFRAEDGSWERIDSSLVADGGVWRTRAESEPKLFAAAAGAGDMVSVSLGDGAVFGFGVADAAAVTGEVDGDAVTYPDVRSDADLHVHATPAGAKETIVLKSVDAPTVWDFPLRLQGVTASVEDGAVVLRDSDGTARGVVPPGFMEDSDVDPRSGEGARSYAVDYELVGDAAAPVLRVRVDEAWLADPERVFPVKVDPTVSKDSTASTYVMSPYTNDYSGEPTLSVGTFNGGGNKAAAYLKFNSLSSELAGQYVLGARLWLYESWSYSCQARRVTVHPVTQSWSASGSKSYPGPSYGAKIAEKSFAYGHSSGCGSRWVDLDLGEGGKSLIHGWTHGSPNHGLTVRASTTDSYGWKKFASASSANPPSLSVTYTPYFADYQVGAMTEMVSSTGDGTMQVSVTNRGKDTWTPTNGYELGYRIWDVDGDELPYGEWAAWTKMPRNVAPGETVTVAAKLKSIPPGRYRVRWDMGLRGTTRFSWNEVPMSQDVWFTIGNQTPVVGSTSPPSNFNSTTLTPTLVLTGRDRDTYPGTSLQYRFKICEASGSNCTETGWLTSPRWSVPEGTLRWSKNYVWYGQLSDTETTSLWTQGSYLSTRVPQPAITSRLSGTDGVDPGVGNFSTPVTDASVATVGPALAVTRTYNSLDPRRAAAFGSGWATSWDARVVPDADGSGNVVVTYPSGRQARFGRNPDGSLAAPSGEHTTLVAATGGGWTLRVKGGTRYTFDSNGRLSAIIDAAGREQNLAYDGSGKLATATDAASGRSLSFTWTDGHVTQVRTSSDLALTWTYSYTGDRLTQVCDPTNVCTSYTYEAGSHYRSVAMDANPQAYWRLAEDSGATAESEVPGFWGEVDGTAVNVAFGQPGPLSGSPTTAAGFDGTSSYVQLPDDLVRNSAYASVEMWFKTTSTAGGVLFSTSHYLPGAANPSGSMPVLYVGTDGKLHGYFWNWQVGGMASPGAVNDGQWHHVVLSGASDTQTLYLDGDEIGTLSGTLGNIDPYNFIGVGAVNDRAWPAKPAGTWSYFDGDIAEAAFYQHPLGASVVAEHYAARAASDQLTAITGPGGVVEAQLTYDDAEDRVTTHIDSDGGIHTVGKPTVEGDGFRYGTSVRESTPNAYWRMREKDGIAADGQPALRRGTYHGSSYRGVGPFPDSGSRMFFDGGYLQLPDDTIRDSRQMSVELWFKVAPSGSGALFSIADHRPGEASSGGSMPVLYVGTDGKLYGHFWQGNVPGISSQASVADGDWHHVVLSGNVDTQTLYLDGNAVGSLSGEIQNHRVHTFVGTAWTRNLAWPQIGDRDWASFDGEIAQVAVYQRAIGAADASAHYAARGSRTTYLDAVRTTDPHTLWGLEDTNNAAEASIDDSMGSSTYHDAALAAEPAMRGAGAVGFNGTSSYLKLPNNQLRGRTRLAVEMWFQTSSAEGGVLYATGFDTPGATTPSSGAFPVLYVGTDGKLRGGFWDGSIAGITSQDAVNDGEWHHVVLTGDGERQELYLDGNLVDTGGDGVIRNLDRFDYVGVGRFTSTNWPARPTQEWGFFDGRIGEVALYHRPLDSASVSAHYSAKTVATAVTLTDPAGDYTTYRYDPTRGGRLVSTTAPGGATRELAYDTGGYVRQVTDENGHTVSHSNDERGNRLSTTTCRDDGVDACYTTTRSYYLNPDDPLDPRNDRITEILDARTTLASGDTYLTRYTYTPSGDVATVEVPGDIPAARRTTTHAYTDGTEAAVGGGTQPPGLLATTTDPEGGVTSFAYTSSGDLARTTDAAGLVTDYTYDGIGRLASETATSAAVPQGVVTTYAYDGASRPTERRDTTVTNAVTGQQHQQRLVNTYNTDGTLASVTVDDVYGNDTARTTSYTYDSHGRVHTVTDPEGGVTTTEYDNFGAVVRTVDPVGAEFVNTYTPGRHQLATTTVKGFTGDGQAARDVVLESRAYDPAGRLASVTDAMGRTRAYTYYDDNLVATEHLLDYTDPDSGQPRDFLLNSYTYDGIGQITDHTLGDGRLRTATSYDPAGRPTSTTDFRDGDRIRSEHTTYDQLDNPVRVIGRNADWSVHTDVEVGYDPLGRETSETIHTGTESLVTLINRDEAGLVLSEVDPRGTATGADPAQFTTSYTYDALGRQVTATAPPVEVESGGQQPTTATPVTTTGYNTFGEAVDLRDPRGHVTHTSYDKAGRPTTLTLPDYTPPGSTETITATTTTGYDAAGRVISTTDALNQTTTYGYDELGNQRRRTDPPALYGQAGGTWIATYDPLGEQLSTSDPNGVQTFATYDQLGRQITTTEVETVPAPTRNLTTGYRYDELGNPTTITSPTGRVEEATYDDLGNKLTATDGLGNTATWTYDGAGRMISATDPTGRATQAIYDQAGRLLTQSDTDTEGVVRRTREFGYDRAGNPTSITNALGRTTTQTFDALNQTTSITRPVSDTESITTSYGHDRAGNITRVTDGNGNTTVHTTNAWNAPESTIEPATTQTPNPAERTYTTVYDAAGHVAQLRKPGDVTITNSYDPLGNLTKQVGTGASVLTPDREFAYDPAGRRTSVSAPGAANTYTYDDRGNLVATTGPAGDTSYTYDDDGRQTSVTTAAGTTTYTYDLAGRLTTAADPLTGATVGYTYDPAGRVTHTDYGAGNATRTYTHDGLGRLATDTVEAPDGTTTASISYDYDDEDQLTTKTTTGLAGAATNTYTYDQAGRLTSWDDGTTVHDYEWDAAGNLTRDGPDTATYNERNQLQAHGDTTYTYTPRGTLTSRTTDGTTTTQQFNAFDELVTDGTTTNTYDGLNRLITTGAASLTYLGTSINVVSDGAGNYTYTPAGTMLGAQHNSTPGLAWTDQHTDLIGLIEPTTGETAGSRAYSPFGETLATTGTQPALGYQHQYTNPDNGTINMGARWYQPGTGTFTSRDTTTLHPQDLANANRYAYAAGSPLTRTDPSGGTVAVCALGLGAGPAAPAAVGGCFAVNGAIALGAMVVGALTVKAVTDAPPRTYNPPRTRTRPSRPTVRRPAPRLDGWTSWLRLSLPLIDGWAAWPDRDKRPQPDPGCLVHCVPVKPPNLPDDGGTAGPTPGNTNQAAYEAYLAYLAWLKARQQRVIDDAMTPHDNPHALDPTIAPSIRAAQNGSLPPIELGELNPTATDDQPYQPENSNNPAQPGPLPPTNTWLDDACADGGQHRANNTRTTQVWQCGPPNSTSTANLDGKIAANAPDVAVQQDAAGVGDGDLVRVGRWMSRAEHDAMVQSGVVQEGAGGTTYVAHPADPAAYGRQAAPGTGYVEFDVPRSSLYPAGEPGWAQIPGPNSLRARLALRRGLPAPQFPAASNIQWLVEK